MQPNTIGFIDYVVETCPFSIRAIRTGRSREFRALFYRRVAVLGMEHVNIKP
jgi:hypothetical protein